MFYLEDSQEATPKWPDIVDSFNVSGMVGESLFQQLKGI